MGVAKFGPLNKCRRGNGPDEVGEIVPKLQAIFAVNTVSRPAAAARTKVIHGQISIGIKNIFSQIIASMGSISSKTVVSVKKVPLG